MVFPVYSAVCETNSAAYIRYLDELRAARLLFVNGSGNDSSDWRERLLYPFIRTDADENHGRCCVGLVGGGEATRRSCEGHCDGVGRCCFDTFAASDSVADRSVNDSEGDKGCEVRAGCFQGETGVHSIVEGKTVVNDSVLEVKERGKHWRKNKAKREKKKKERELVPEWRRDASPLVGYFSGCEESVKIGLRDSRAKMLIEKNKTDCLRAELESSKIKALIQSRVSELEVEQRRLRAVEWRNKIVSETSVGGFAETVVSEGVSSAAPSLSDGSMSPTSSISVAELNKLQRDLHNLTNRVAELKTENQKLRSSDSLGSLNESSDFVKSVKIHNGGAYSSWETSVMTYD